MTRVRIHVEIIKFQLYTEWCLSCFADTSPAEHDIKVIIMYYSNSIFFMIVEL